MAKGIPVPSNSPLDGDMHVCQFSRDWLAIVTGALSDLYFINQWDSPPSDIVAQLDELINLIEENLTIPPGMPIGAIIAFPQTSDHRPSGWLYCDGSAVSRTTYAALFDVLGTTYGSGNGTTTFNIPDLRLRFLLQSSADSSSFIGTQDGSDQHSLTVDELPAHHHQQHVDSNSLAWQPGGSGSRHNIATGTPGTSATALITENTGSGDAFSLMPPYQTVAMCIYAGV